MKKAITFTLIAILFLGLFAGCNTYTRPVVHEADGARVTRGFQYRDDGFLTDGGTTRRAHVNDHVRDGRHHDGTLHNFRYGGGVTGFDGRATNRGLATHSTTIDPNGVGNGHYGTATARPAVNGVARSAAR